MNDILLLKIKTYIVVQKKNTKLKKNNSKNIIIFTQKAKNDSKSCHRNTLKNFTCRNNYIVCHVKRVTPYTQLYTDEYICDNIYIYNI